MKARTIELKITADTLHRIQLRFALWRVNREQAP